MSRWRVWALVTAAMLVVLAYAFLNFWAAADLGYDASPEGASILAFWGYSALGAFGFAVTAAGIAVYSWRRARRDSRT